MNSTRPTSERPQTAAGSDRRRGFTLVELLVTMAIIGILVALTLPAVQRSRASARKIDCANRLRNVNTALLNVMESTGRFPACGSFSSTLGKHHSWVVDVLPWLEQKAISDAWRRDLPLEDPANEPLTHLHISVLTCPSDISVAEEGDLSYVVNGGVGFTAFLGGVHDCPCDPNWQQIDLNGNGVTCPPSGTGDGDPTDKDYLLRMGLFFNETVDSDISRRSHRPATVHDGMSNTFLLAENVRTGFNPDAGGDPWLTGWATPHPLLTSFYIGNPCLNGVCAAGQVDYARSNAGEYAINSGLTKPEGESPVPNSFHAGGVNVSFADGRVQFLNERIDGGVYAALASPQGLRLAGSPLQQTVATGEF